MVMQTPIQTDYNDTFANGYDGMIANAEDQNRISRTVEDAAGIAFGKAVFRGAGDHGCTATPAATKFLGVTIVDHGVPVLVAGANPDRYAQGETAGIMKRGVVWVTPAVAVSDGDQVYVTPAGAFTNVAAGNVAIPCEFDDTVGAGVRVRLRIFEQKLAA